MLSAIKSLVSLCVLCGLCGESLSSDPWATYRGNPARTGNTDGKPGPDKPAVLWVVPSQDHFIAAPVPAGDHLLASGFGAFNRPTLSAIPAADGKKPLWSRTAPVLTLASVSSPAVSGNQVVLGDGLHQDSGGALHALAVDSGRLVWRLPLPGALIHLEGGPTVVGGRVFTGAGSAGVLCVDADKLTLDGKDVTAAELVKLQDAKWKELQAKFEEAKKKDPDFAVPPSEDQLPRPSPKIAWQAGAKKWHVDAAVNVIGDVVIACSGFLDEEKVGERAVCALDAKTGEVKWTQKLTANPWGGASVSGDTVIVTGSTVGLYPERIKGAKGEVAAFDRKAGTPKWRKDVPGGVTGCAAIADGLAVTTATDGKVRAYSLADGDREWVYDAKAPLFAPPAVAAGMVYAADLAGMVHAVSLKDGTPKWKLDLGADPAVKSAGMIYGGVTVHGGRLFVATCNHEGPHARQPTAVVCIGAR